LIRSELHLNPRTLSNQEFIERSREVLWLLKMRDERLKNNLKTAMLETYIEVMKARVNAD